MEKDNEGKIFYQLECLCEENFRKNKYYWHLCTPGTAVPIIFECKEDFEYGKNLMAWCADKFPDVKIFTYTIMNNHLHMIMAGEADRCMRLFETYKAKLQRYLITKERFVSLSKFEAQLIPITDLKMLRTEILYTNRNGYVALPEYNPYSYPWGAGRYFFNSMTDMLTVKSFNELPIRTRRRMCKCKDVVMAHDMKVVGNVIIAPSFCHIKEAEGFFRTSRQYFASLVRNHEAFCESAKRLGDTIFLPTEELLMAVVSICQKRYNIRQPALLPPNAKLEIAKLLHYDYHANNSQIRSILKMDPELINELFPNA
jgi:REP element-mobilizing transposase RayT